MDFSESWFWDILSRFIFHWPEVKGYHFVQIPWSIHLTTILFTSPRYNHFLDTWCVTGSPLHSFLSCLPGLQAIQVLPLCQSVEACYLGCCQCLDAIVATTGRVDAKNTVDYLPSTNNRKENKDLMGSPCMFGDVTVSRDWGYPTRLAKQISK